MIASWPPSTQACLHRYYTLFLVAGAASQAVISEEGREHSTLADASKYAHAVTYTCSLFCVLPAMDSIPPELLSQHVRLAMFGFISAVFLFLCIEGKMLLDCNERCPKLIVDGYVVVSALQIAVRSYIIVCLLALHGFYRCWRFSTQAVLLEAPIPFCKLHVHETQTAACQQVEQPRMKALLLGQG